MGGSDSEAPVFVEFILPPFEMLFGERPKHTSYIIIYIYIILNHPVHCLLSTAGEWQQLMINETVHLIFLRASANFPQMFAFKQHQTTHVLNICTTTADRMDTMPTQCEHGITRWHRGGYAEPVRRSLDWAVGKELKAETMEDAQDTGREILEVWWRTCWNSCM